MFIISFNLQKWMIIILINFYLFDYSLQSIEPNDEAISKHSDRLVVMTRHGQSEWSENNIFCGWYDSPLSNEGKKDAIKLANTLKHENYKFDIAFTSVLERATNTLSIVLEVLDQSHITVVKSWKLNERHYGSLTGLKKANSITKFGEKKLALWRRSYDIPPPPMEKDHPYYADINNEATKKLLGDAEIPTVESFKTTASRVIPYWTQFIEPKIREGKKVLIVAHGTVLRSLVMYIEKLSEEEISEVELPVGHPFYYEFNENMEVMAKTRTFLGSPEEIEERIKQAKYIKRTESGKVLIQ